MTNQNVDLNKPLTAEEEAELQAYLKENAKKAKSIYKKVEIISFVIGFLLATPSLQAAFSMAESSGIGGLIGGLFMAVCSFIIFAGIPFGWMKIAGRMPLLESFFIGFVIDLMLAVLIGWFCFLRYWISERKIIFGADL